MRKHLFKFFLSHYNATIQCRLITNLSEQGRFLSIASSMPWARRDCRGRFCLVFSTKKLVSEKFHSGERVAAFAARSPIFSPPQLALLSPHLPSSLPRNALSGGGVDIERASRLLSTTLPCYVNGTAVLIARLASEYLECPKHSDISSQRTDKQNVRKTRSKLAYLRAREDLVANFPRMRAFAAFFCQDNSNNYQQRFHHYDRSAIFGHRERKRGRKRHG